VTFELQRIERLVGLSIERLVQNLFFWSVDPALVDPALVVRPCFGRSTLLWSFDPALIDPRSPSFGRSTLLWLVDPASVDPALFDPPLAVRPSFGRSTLGRPSVARCRTKPLSARTLPDPVHPALLSVKYVPKMILSGFYPVQPLHCVQPEHHSRSLPLLVHAQAVKPSM
jgi:hypothetical protein